MAIVDVKIPEGFEVVDAAYDQVIINQPSDAREITYTMVYLQGGAGATEAYDAYFAKKAQFYIDLSSQLQTKCEREQIEICLLYTST